MDERVHHRALHRESIQPPPFLAFHDLSLCSLSLSLSLTPVCTRDLGIGIAMLSVGN
jgi:hypothetical protein